jgi:PIN domain nuclease of toxin-antitoxin system
VPLLETDLIFAYLNTQDKHHKTAKTLFKQIKQGTKVNISPLTLIELELLYKTNKIENQLTPHITALTTLPNTTYTPLTPETILTAITLRQEHRLTFFDSHYAATALQTDQQIISIDQAYSQIPGLTHIDPTK